MPFSPEMPRPLLILLLLLAFRPWAGAQSEIMPPFGLEWGESTERMERLITGAKAKVASRSEKGGRTVWVVEGLKQENLKATRFYFRNGGLEEVELQYENPAWTEAEYNRFLSQLRSRIDQRFGAGKLTARSREPVESVTQTLVGYLWQRGPSRIELIYFAAEDSAQAFRTVSLHYKAVY